MYVIYPSIVNYTYLFQRPQQLMRCFGKNGFTSVFFNNGATIDGCTQYSKATKVDKNLFVVPSNYKIKKTQEDCIFYNTFPGYADKNKDYNTKFTIFDCIDEPTGIFSTWDVDGSWKRAIQNADLVLASAQKLYKEAKKMNKNCILVPNGCDFEHFKAKKKWGELPEKMKPLTTPIITFSGAVASWLDYDLITEMAEEFSDTTVLMVGALYDVKYDDAPSNVHLIGHQPYQELPPYLHHSDVLIIPFDTKNPVIEATNPIKLWEYLAIGKPIVTTNIPEADKKYVYKSRTKKQFIKNVKKSFNGLSEKRKEENINLAKENSWDERMDRILVELEKAGIYEK